MLTVHNGNLAVEAKGIYSLEKFLIARRLMYWQVYLHKTVVSAEYLLMKILLRAKELIANGEELDASDSLRFLLKNEEAFDVSDSDVWLKHFLKLDDFDVLYSMKQWIDSEDKLISNMCKRLINRQLLKVKILDRPLTDDQLNDLREKAAKTLNHDLKDMRYLVFQNSLSNRAYSSGDESINILYKDGSSKDISEAASIFRFSSLEASESKHFVYFPEEISFQ